MNRNGPILLIEDDVDDREMIGSLYMELGYTNKLVFLRDGAEALQYLNEMTEVPFLIISDINLPKLDGLQLRDRVYNNHHINLMCIPYIILSTSVDKRLVDLAYSTGIQGYFQKPDSYVQLYTMLQHIIEYWKRSYSPGNFMKHK